MNKKLVCSLLCLMSLGLTSCNDAHEHTFSDSWKYDSTMHWHESSCEHEGLASGLAPHNYGNDNVCVDCGYVKPTKYYNFNFVSDFCNLNNEHAYEEGESVELTLTPQSGKNMPESIEVYINGELANEADYSFDKTTGKITIVVTGDILVRVMSDANVAKYQINSQQFTDAFDFEDEQYVQVDMSSGFYCNSYINYINRVIECGANVVHASVYNLTASQTFAYSSYIEEYIEKDGQVYNCYSYDTYDGWEKQNYDGLADEYNDARKNIAYLYYIGNPSLITFDKLEGHFNNLTCTYDIEFVATLNEKQINWEMQLLFLNGKIVSIDYYSEGSITYFGYYTFTYNQVTPVIPQEALNAGQVD